MANDAATAAHTKHAKTVKDLQDADKQVEKLKEAVEATSAQAELRSPQAKEATVASEIAAKSLQGGGNAEGGMELDPPLLPGKGLTHEDKEHMEQQIEKLHAMLQQASSKLAAAGVPPTAEQAQDLKDMQEQSGAFRKLKAKSATAAARAKAAPYARMAAEGSNEGGPTDKGFTP